MAQEAPTRKIKLEDIYFVLFRHKWMVIGFFVLGLAGAGAAWKSMGTKYTSEAQLLVRYIIETGAVLPPGGDDRARQFREVDVIGDVFSTEIQILSSADLARTVASAVGPERLVGDSGGEDLLEEATGIVLNGLHRRVQANVIKVTFSHPDRELCQPVLRQLIKDYLRLHGEIHLSGVKGDLLAKELEERKARLQHTEQELQETRRVIGGVSLEDARRTVASEIEAL